MAEAYRQLRTAVLLSTPGHAPKTLLVTSCVPAEGKTTSSINLAASLAQTNAKVLLIDADLRRPRLRSIFGMNGRQGLSTVLSREMSEADLLSLIHQHDGSNLYVLASGPVPPNPAELLGSEQMRRMLKMLEPHFTHIVIDSAPVASFTDGVLISSMVDGVLMVIRCGQTPRETLYRSRQMLTAGGANILGVVLNQVEMRSTSYYQGYYQQPLIESNAETGSFVAASAWEPAENSIISDLVPTQTIHTNEPETEVVATRVSVHPHMRKHKRRRK